jgi:hypothetical protein
MVLYIKIVYNKMIRNRKPVCILNEFKGMIVCGLMKVYFIRFIH